jgi:hypothetical protein
VKALREKAVVYSFLGSFFLEGSRRRPGEQDRDALAILRGIFEDYPDVESLGKAAGGSGGGGREGPSAVPERHSRQGGRREEEADRESRGTSWFRDTGFTLHEELGVPEDHVGVELMFLAHLRNGEAEFLERGDIEEAGEFRRVAKEFMRARILSWRSRFFERLCPVTREPALGPLAPVAQKFILMDAEALGEA